MKISVYTEPMLGPRVENGGFVVSVFRRMPDGGGVQGSHWVDRFRITDSSASEVLRWAHATHGEHEVDVHAVCRDARGDLLLVHIEGADPTDVKIGTLSATEA